MSSCFRKSPLFDLCSLASLTPFNPRPLTLNFLWLIYVYSGKSQAGSLSMVYTSQYGIIWALWWEGNNRFERERTCPLCRAVVKLAGVRSYGDGSTNLFIQLFWHIFSFVHRAYDSKMCHHHTQKNVWRNVYYGVCMMVSYSAHAGLVVISHSDFELRSTIFVLHIRRC